MATKDKRVDSDVEGDEDKMQLANPDTVTKYKTAADIANRVLAHVKSLVVAGATVLSITQAGDKMILDEAGKVYKKKVTDEETGKSELLPKGIAFPTCVSVNNVVCHFSPLVSDEAVTLKEGDVVKIDLGAHIDGYAAVVASTVVVGATEANPATGPKADAILAAHYAAEAALRLLKPGNKTNQITAVIGKVADSYKTKPIEGMLSYNLTQNVIDGEKTIIQNPSDEQRKGVKNYDIEVHDVWAIDILVSSGEGKAKASEARTTVYKKTDQIYQLKMKTSRAVYSELSQKFTTFPFTLRAFEDEKKARMGITECVNHQLVQTFPVMLEAPSAVVAQIKFTVLVTSNGTVRITDPGTPLATLRSEHSIEDEETKTLLAQEVDAPKKAKKKAAKKAGEAAPAPAQ
eukprot:comp18605_c0_seq1/m.20174 comp18605_c0_seq1/g.20174  ORF comp18605_c0_seq1/g.20174 comp18605_c0_seq1/m.20174 type:complete len:403 (-) comp18605_c0_seq1:253-1461(-)